MSDMLDVANAIERRILKLETENERLRTALRPFASEAKDGDMDGDMTQLRIPALWLRNAKDALLSG